MKKLKLVMSIATMCLAIAVLCFGVLAATSVSYTIGGSISYVVNDVFATVETDVYTSSFNNATNLKAEAEKFLTSDTVENAVQTDYKYDFTTKGLDSENYSNLDALEGNTTGGINIAYNTTDQRTYFVVISITNNGDNIISASVSGTLGENANTTFVKTNPITSLSKSNKQKIVMAFMLDDITLGMSDINFEYVVTINNGEIAGPIATFSYLNYDNEFTVDETKTKVLTEQITDSPFELDGDHFDTQGYLYNFQLSDIDTSKFNNVQVTFSTSNSFMIFIAPKCYANFQELGKDVSSENIVYVMALDTASAYYDLTEATPLNFCIFIVTDGETELTSGYNLKISISKSFTEGEFRYFATNKDTEWVVGPKDENITGEITIPKTFQDPETFQDKPVVGLQQGMGLFGNCNNIRKVIIQDNIKEIPMGCFYGSVIQELVLGSGIELIGEEAFYRCNNLTTVTFETGSKLTSIGDYAFHYCTCLTSIEIPSSVTSIGTDVFYKCSGLESITVSGTGGTYTAQGNCLIKGTELVAGCKTSVIPTDGSVTSIGDYAFNGCSGLTSINIPSRVTSIGNYAFDGCSGLTSIEIPNSVISIGESAFYGCSGLTSINIPSSLTSIRTNAFAGCSSLTSITIPSSVTSIGDQAFSGCSGLTSITIPSSVTSIGTWAFERCSGLTSVTFEEGSQLTSIDRAFDGCSGLTSITIPSSVTSIEYRAFYGCSGLTSITIPSSVTSIGESAFSGCSDLTTINFTGTQAQWNDISKSSANIKAGVNVVCTDGTIVTE